MPVVMVSLPPAIPPPQAEVAIAACTAAYVEGECEATENDWGEDATEVIKATLRWQSDTLVELRMGLEHWRERRWYRQVVRFSEEDEPPERYRTLGYTVGSLAGTIQQISRAERDAKRKEQTDPITPPVFHSAPSAPSAQRMELLLGGRGGSCGLSFGAGGEVGYTHGWGSLLEFDGAASVITSGVGSDGVSCTEIAAFAGLGVGLDLGSWRWNAAVGPLLYRVDFERQVDPTLIAPNTPSAVNASRGLQLGVELRSNLRWTGGQLSPYLSASLAAVSGTDLLLADNVIARVPNLRWSASVGVAWTIPD